MTDKAKLLLMLDSPTGYSANVEAQVTPEQWATIQCVVEGVKTQAEKLLMDQIYDLQQLLHRHNEAIRRQVIAGFANDDTKALYNETLEALDNS